MSLPQDILHGLGTGPKIRDWRHANQIFVGNNYALKPKDSFLFHVRFEINNGPSGVSKLDNENLNNLSFLVKNIQIPKFTIDTKTMNAYNRPNIVQQKIKYDPIQITFHDDSSDTVRDFWYDYMSHYYRDSDYTPDTYLQSHKYNSITKNKNFWGYQPAKYSSSADHSERILNRVKIYSLHQKRFSEYTLINPIITGFQHGQHQQGQSEFLENTMTIAYETVLYQYGTVKYDNEPAGFATLGYDNTASPLTAQGGGTASILGPGGLLSAVQGISQDVDGGKGLGYAAAGVTALRTFNNLKGQNLLGMAGTELKNIATGILSGDTNTLNRLSIPKAGPTNGVKRIDQSSIQT